MLLDPGPQCRRSPPPLSRLRPSRAQRSFPRSFPVQPFRITSKSSHTRARCRHLSASLCTPPGTLHPRLFQDNLGPQASGFPRGISAA